MTDPDADRVLEMYLEENYNGALYAALFLELEGDRDDP